MKDNSKKLKQYASEDFAEFLKNDEGRLIDFGIKTIENEDKNCIKEDINCPPAKKAKLSEEKIKATTDVISSWSKLLRENFPGGLEELTCGLKASIAFAEASTIVEPMKYEVSDIETHRSIINTCTVEMVPLLRKYLSLQGPKSKNSSPSSSHRWKNVQPIMEEYLASALKLLDGKADATTLEMSLKHLIDLPQFFLCFPKIATPFIEQLVVLWSESNEVLQCLTNQCLSALILSANEIVTKFTLRKVYLAFMLVCKNTSAATMLSVTSMRKQLVEMLCLKPKSAQAFIAAYLQQMRKCVDSVEKKKMVPKVVCWQFFQSLSLWVEVIGFKNGDEQLKELKRPLCNLILTIVGSNVSPVHAPMRLSCVRLLLDLSRKTGLFVPALLSVILEPLRWRMFEEEPENSSMKSFLYSFRLHLTNSELQEKLLVEETLNEVLELLLDYSNLHSKSVAFPELMNELFKSFKSFKESCIFPGHTKKLEQVVNKIKAVSDKVEKKRKADALDLKDKVALNVWENELKDEKNELKKLYDNLMKEKCKKQELALKNEMVGLILK